MMILVFAMKQVTDFYGANIRHGTKKGYIAKMIYVCDSIMGSGKSSAVINYMNNNPEKRYIYITPYLEEAARIKNGCPGLEFVEPDDKLSEYGNSKSGHTAALIAQGRNITSTHQALKQYTSAMLNNIRKMEYVLIIDENIEMLQDFKAASDDITMLTNEGYIVYQDGYYRRTKKPYSGGVLSKILSAIQKCDVTSVSVDSKKIFFWLLSPKLISSFSDVYILTYLFEGQSIHHFMQINKLDYDLIGARNNGGTYEFCEFGKYAPDYVKELRNKIHILDNDRLNEVGDKRNALSVNWYKKDTIMKLKKNIDAYFRYHTKGISSDKRLWSVYDDFYKKIASKGFIKNYIPFNSRATNKYSDRTCLAYLCNVYVNLPMKKFYESRGVEINDDAYALSTMVQWIWRSAIRNGEEVWLYLPSKRMRTILNKWLDDLENGVCNE